MDMKRIALIILALVLLSLFYTAAPQDRLTALRTDINEKKEQIIQVMDELGIVPLVVKADVSCYESSLGKYLGTRLSESRNGEFVIYTNNNLKSIAFESEEYAYIGILTYYNFVSEIQSIPCVKEVSIAKDNNELINEIRILIKEETLAKIDELKLKLSHQDVIDFNVLKAKLKNESPIPQDAEGGIISEYQLFVTPLDRAVVSLAAGKTPEQLYYESMDWMWVSDTVLNGTEEKWLTPGYFLTQSQTMPTNPMPGKIASDCSEQANTLVSAIRASGVPSERVRVGIGFVNFSGVIGGHAWAEIYDETLMKWVVIDATAGDYWDETTNQFVERAGVSYDYWAKRAFPIIQVWAYYNDEFYYEPNSESNAPKEWGTAGVNTAEEETMNTLDNAIVEASNNNSINEGTIDYSDDLLNEATNTPKTETQQTDTTPILIALAIIAIIIIFGVFVLLRKK
jgi:hypothetical protein